MKKHFADNKCLFFSTVESFLMNNIRRPNAYSVAEMGRSRKSRAAPSMATPPQWGQVTVDNIL